MMPKTFDTPTRKLALSINESDLENTGTSVPILPLHSLKTPPDAGAPGI